MTSRFVHFSVSYVPRSQMVIVPAPYSPRGMSPSNVAYSSGWSSVCTARWLVFGSRGIPLGTAQDTSTPPRSSRRSQCRDRAWCSWITKVLASRDGCELSDEVTGSGGLAASRLRRDVPSLSSLFRGEGGSPVRPRL